MHVTFYYKNEWQGTTIEIVNTLIQCELRIDGETKDILKKFFVKNGTILSGINKNGDKIQVIFESHFIPSGFILSFNNNIIDTKCIFN